MPKRPVLVTLGKITAVVHVLIYTVAVVAMILVANVDSWATAAAPFTVLGLLVLSLTTLSKVFFNDDCALRIFEYCLRGLGGEEIDHNRLNSMPGREALMLEPIDLYRRLLWQSGLFLIIATAICIGGVIAAVIWL